MLPVEVTSTTTTAQKLPTIFRDKPQNPAMTPRSYPCIINIIRDLVNSIEDRSGIDLPSPGFDPAERFAIESFLIGVLDRYGKVKCNSGTSDQSNSNGGDTPPLTPVSTPSKSSPKESQSATIDLDTAQTSPASDANSTPTASRGSGAKSKRARTEALKSSSPAKGTHCKTASGSRCPSLRAKSPSLYDESGYQKSEAYVNTNKVQAQELLRAAKACAYYDPDLKTSGDTENNDPSQRRDENDSNASEQSQSYVPAGSPPNEKKRGYSADEAENTDSPQTYKRARTPN